MAISAFIPEVWSARLYQALDKAHVFVANCNRNYEGDITNFGDKVWINGITDITIAPYTRSSTTVTPAELAEDSRFLTIDQANYFAFKMDDVNNAQVYPKIMDEGMRKAAYGLSDTADSYVAGLYASADASNAVSDLVLTSKTALATLASCASKLDLNNVPRDGRFLIVDPTTFMKLTLANILNDTDNSMALGNGFVGRCMGFDIFMSNNVVQGTDADADKFYCLFGTADAITYADQLLKVEAYRPEAGFTDAVKGLHVFGAKVIEPKALGCLTAKIAAEA